MLSIRSFFVAALTAFSTVFAAPQLVLFNDTSAWYHWGCTGTSIALKEEMHALGFDIHSFPINVTYALKEVPSFDEFDDDEKFERFKEENKEVIEAIQNGVAVVITGEGTIHDLRTGPRALLYVAHVSKKYMGKHVEIINHSAYPKDDPALLGNFLNNFIPGSAEKVTFRLRQNPGIEIVGEGDCIPSILPPSPTTQSRELSRQPKCDFFKRVWYRQKSVVVAGSVSHTKGAVEKLCLYLEQLALEGFEIKVLIGAAAFPSQDDLAFVDCIQEHCKADWKLIQATCMDEWLDTINDATFLVSGRFHHSIAAFCLNTPFISLNSNTHKVHAICALLGQDEPLLYSDPDLLDHLHARVQTILSSPVVHNDVTEICELAKQNFAGLKALSETVHGELATSVELSFPTSSLSVKKS